jgi:hypothetical protein
VRASSSTAPIPGWCRITSFTPGRTFSFRALSPGLRYDGLVDVVPEGDGCRFTLTGDITVTGPCGSSSPCSGDA